MLAEAGIRGVNGADAPQRLALVLGDSHAAVFEGLRLPVQGLADAQGFEVCSVGRATASGLENPNSATHARERFVQALAAQPCQDVVVLLGEVDTGFVIWHRAQTRGIPVLDSLDQTLCTYTGFLDELARSRRVWVLSAPLPTIQDGQSWGEVANLRREVRASLFERTQLTLMFNNAVAEHARRNAMRHVNLDPHSIGGDRLVRDALRSPDPLDHHYDRTAFQALIRAHGPWR